MLGFFHYTEHDFDSILWEFQAHRFEVDMPGLVFRESYVHLDVTYFLKIGETGNLISPARLSFKGITDLRMNLDTSNNRFQNSPTFFVSSATRKRVEEQLVYLDRPYYAWTLALNGPDIGEISFGAYGFSLRQTGFKRFSKVMESPEHTFRRLSAIRF